MTTLVVGGTGKVGGETVRRLAERGEPVRVLSRSGEEASLPPGIAGVRGDLADPESVRAAFAGVSRAVLITPLHPEEGRLGVHAVEAAAEAGVARLVFLTIHCLEQLPDALHVTAKRTIAARIAELDVPATLIAPSSFYQNDLGAREPILEHGAYPIPLGRVGCSCIDTRDVGEAIVRALDEPATIGATLPLVGPERMTGPQAAEVWSRCLGRPVRYAADDLDAWARQMRAAAPGWLVEALATMYGHIAEHGLPATEDEVVATTRLLGRPPRRYQPFVEETAKSWGQVM
jgi:uncharacterized protein YbjT (DUF2867 family)